MPNVHTLTHILPYRTLVVVIAFENGRDGVCAHDGSQQIAWDGWEQWLWTKMAHGDDELSQNLFVMALLKANHDKSSQARMYCSKSHRIYCLEELKRKTFFNEEKCAFASLVHLLNRSLHAMQSDNMTERVRIRRIRGNSMKSIDFRWRKIEREKNKLHFRWMPPAFSPSFISNWPSNQAWFHMHEKKSNSICHILDFSHNFSFDTFKPTSLYRRGDEWSVAMCDNPTA